MPLRAGGLAAPRRRPRAQPPDIVVPDAARDAGCGTAPRQRGIIATASMPHAIAMPAMPGPQPIEAGIIARAPRHSG
jgi:hypothetical protein